MNKNYIFIKKTFIILACICIFSCKNIESLESKSFKNISNQGGVSIEDELAQKKAYYNEALEEAHGEAYLSEESPVYPEGLGHEMISELKEAYLNSFKKPCFPGLKKEEPKEVQIEK